MATPVAERPVDYAAVAVPTLPRAEVPSSPRVPPFAVLSFFLFVLGGLAFAGLFVANARQLMLRPQSTLNLPIAGPVPLSSIPVLPMAAPGSVPELKANPVTVARTLLPEWKGTERINLLLLGIDRREGEAIAGTRSDTMMLLSVDPVAKSAAMVSLPRDMWVNIPGYGQQRINVAHAVGGPDLAKRTITEDFGIPVQYYARVDFSGFEQIVDTLGGVLVDVERPIKDDQYPAENFAYQRIYIAPGLQLMGGTTALQYARSRHSENDFGRARRQQRVLVAMRDRALKLDVLPRAPQLLDTVLKSMSTDLSPTQLLALARLASEIDSEMIGTLVIDANLARPFRSEDGADLLLPDTPAIRRAIDRALRTAARPELRSRVEVLNGSERPGVAQDTANYLTDQGFAVTNVALADRRDYQQSSVQVLTENRSAGEAIAAALGLPPGSVTDLPTRGAPADVRVVLGADFSGVSPAASQAG